ncbi:TPA: hypothetical protein ACUI22_002135 [Staphylococcus aureus]
MCTYDKICQFAHKLRLSEALLYFLVDRINQGERIDVLKLAESIREMHKIGFYSESYKGGRPRIYGDLGLFFIRLSENGIGHIETLRRDKYVYVPPQ